MRRVPPAALAVLLAATSCDVSTQQDVGVTSTLLLAPVVSTDSGIALPAVDSVRLSIYGIRSETFHYQASVPWSRHGDTLPAIVVGESLLVRIEGVRVQADSSRSVWWSGYARTWFPPDAGGGVRDVRIPVTIRDTIPPRVLSRGGDTVGNADSMVHVVWRLGAGCGCAAVVDGEAVDVAGDSAVWVDEWASGAMRTVVASFRDKAGNLLRDTATVFRRQRVAEPVITLSSTAEGYVSVELRSSTIGASFEYSLDSGATWNGFDGSLVVTSSLRLHARATVPGMETSVVSEGVCEVEPVAPTFSVPSGTSWNDFLAVRIGSDLPDADIQYAIDDSGWHDYSDSIVLGGAATLRARAVRNGAPVGVPATATYDVRASEPTFSVRDGASFSDTAVVRLECETPGAAIEYSIDSGRSWLPYGDSIVLRGSISLLARAGKAGLATSRTATARYIIALPAPTFSIPSDTRWNDIIVVRLSCPVPGATLMYSANGTSWTTGDSVVVGSTTQLWARAMKAGMPPGSVARASYVVQAAPPTFSVTGGLAHSDAFAVRLSSSTPASLLQYSLDTGATWNSYRDSLVVSRTVALLARTTKAGLATSAVSEAVYDVALPAPTFSVASGTSWNDLLTVRVESGVPGADILWSFDSVTWNRYADSIVVGASRRVWARNTKQGMAPGAVAQAFYGVVASAPEFSVATGTSANDLMTVRLSSATPGATIQYSLDTNRTWRTYVDSLVVGSDIALFARAFKPGLATSTNSMAVYDVSVAEPTVSVPSGTFAGHEMWVKAKSATPGARIQVSPDSFVWVDYKEGDSIRVWSNAALWFRALKEGMQPSPIRKAVYYIGAWSLPPDARGPRVALASAPRPTRLLSDARAASEAPCYVPIHAVSIPASSSTRLVAS